MHDLLILKIRQDEYSEGQVVQVSLAIREVGVEREWQCHE